MQPNNKIRPFSTNTDNKYSDSDVGTLPVIGTGAVNGARADSKLYNSLSANTSLVACALADLIASQNKSITFGQETPIDTWLQAVKDTFATTLVVNSIIYGTTTVGNATNVKTNINGKPISSIFENDGITVKNATNSTNSNFATYASADTTKGTIEERLTRLGFKQGTLSLEDDVPTPTTNYIYRQGNYVYGELEWATPYEVGALTETAFATIPDDFKPKISGTIFSAEIGTQSVKIYSLINHLRITAKGTSTSTRIKIKHITFGYEANPIE